MLQDHNGSITSGTKNLYIVTRPGFVAWIFTSRAAALREARAMSADGERVCLQRYGIAPQVLYQDVGDGAPFGTQTNGMRKRLRAAKGSAK